MKSVSLMLLVTVFFLGLTNSSFGQGEQRLRFISNETFQGEKTFSFSIGSQEESIRIYLFAQTYEKSDRERGGPTSGYFEVDGKRVHTWTNEWHINPEITLKPGEHVITIALNDKAWVQVFDLRILSKNVDDLRLLPMTPNRLAEIKGRIGLLTKGEKKELFLWLQKEVGQ